MAACRTRRLANSRKIMRYQRTTFGICIGIAAYVFMIFGLRAEVVTGENWYCGLSNHVVTCSHNVAEKFPLVKKRIIEMIKLSNKSGCNPTDLGITGKTMSNTVEIAYISIDEEYTCKIASENIIKLRRVAEKSHSHYSLNCRKALFKYRSTGFDYYSDGSRMRWESRTAGMPWESITDKPTDAYFQKLFDIFCR